MSTREGLPEGWTTCTLGEIYVDRGTTVNPGSFPAETFELYSVPSHPTGRPELVSGSSIKSSKQSVAPGTVLLCKINPRINRTWVVPNEGGRRQIASTEWITFFPVPGLHPPYLSYFLQQGRVRDFLASNASGVGGSLMRVKPSTLAGYPFSLAPLHEQQRISAKIDELFSDLDAGVASLERARANLKRYRASVLKAAVEGRLTEEWRKDHPQAEDGQMLLDRILRERRETWERDQLAGFAAKGKEPPKNWQTKYAIPFAAEPPTESPLPTDWTWATLDAVTSDALIGLDCGRQHQSADGQGCPYIKMNNVTMDGRVLTDELVFVPITPEQQARYSVRVGDLLFNTRNSVELVGKTGLVRQAPRDAVFNNNLMRLRTAINSAYVCLVMCSAPFRSRMEQVKKATTSVAAVYGKDLFPLAIPIPPFAEQDEIAHLVDERCSQIDAAEATIDAELIRSKKLRQGILKQAFEGTLVPQDPGDEPASILLERINATRGAGSPPRPKKTGRAR